MDWDGLVKCTAIPYSGITAGTGVISFTGAPTKTLLTGEAIAIGDFILLGKRVTTHSQLLDDCERYLIAYGVWKGLKRDSSTDSGEQERELAMMRQEIIDSYGENYQDVDHIPIINSDYSEYL